MYYTKVISCSPTQGMKWVTPEALQLMMDEVERMPAEGDSVRRAVVAHLRLADTCRRLRKYDDAIRLYYRALDLCVDDDEERAMYDHRAEALRAAESIDATWLEAHPRVRDYRPVLPSVRRRYVVLYYHHLFEYHLPLWDLDSDEGRIPRYCFTGKGVY